VALGLRLISRARLQVGRVEFHHACLCRDPTSGGRWI
jgi:hypothetical protein